MTTAWCMHADWHCVKNVAEQRKIALIFATLNKKYGEKPLSGNIIFFIFPPTIQYATLCNEKMISFNNKVITYKI